MVLSFQAFVPKCAPGKARTRTGERMGAGEARRDEDVTALQEKQTHFFRAPLLWHWCLLSS